jgi:hypothetical protein
MLASLTYTQLPMLRDWVIFEKIRRKQNMHLNCVAYFTCLTHIFFINKAFERQVAMYWANSHPSHTHTHTHTHCGHRYNKKTSQGLRKFWSVFWFLGPCSLVYIYKHIGGIRCLHLQGRSVDITG